MKWTQSGYLLLLLALPLVLILTWGSERYWQRVRAVWADQGARWHWRSRLRMSLVAALFVTLALALAGPAVQVMAPQNVHDRVTLAIGLDVSKSMLAEDVLEVRDPQQLANRLNLGREFINDLLSELGGERVGLFFFARNGIEVVPATRDHGFIRYILRHTEMGRLTESGSDLIAALSAADSMLAGGSASSVNAVVLISDGEDTENNLEQSITLLRGADVAPRQIYTIRVGSDESVFIPVRKQGIDGIEGFYTDEQGNYLQTRASDSLLQQLATATNGYSWRYHSDHHSLARQVVDQILLHAQQSSVATLTTLTWFDLSGLFLLLAALLYALYLLL